MEWTDNKTDNLRGKAVYCENCGIRLSKYMDLQEAEDGTIVCSDDCADEIDLCDHDVWMDDELENRKEFADPGGCSALRAETVDNPRSLPCPTCGRENTLTPKDVALGYQCDNCADMLERGW